MNCEQALNAILTAGAPELAGEGSSAVASHVRTCAKCNNVAAHILGETGMLQAAVQAQPLRAPAPVRSRVFATRWMVPAASLAAAAMLAIVVLRRAPSGHQATTLAPLRVDQVVPDTGPVTVRVTAAHVSAIASKPARSPKSAETSVAVDVPSISVDPPLGVRAAVIRTSNPTITVVWLY